MTSKNIIPKSVIEFISKIRDENDKNIVIEIAKTTFIKPKKLERVKTKCTICDKMVYDIEHHNLSDRHREMVEKGSISSNAVYHECKHCDVRLTPYAFKIHLLTKKHIKRCGN